MAPRRESRGRALRLATLAALAALAAACGESRAGVVGASGVVVAAAPEDPIAFQEVGDFALVAQTGAPVTAATLAGRPWVASCIFTTCTGPCPSISRTMAEVGRELEGTDARLVSISVDPERDTPEVLERYAESFDADPERWLFLTGEPAEVERLVREGLALPLERVPGAVGGREITHDVRLAVIDGAGRVRGWYQSGSDEEVERLVERVRFLAAEDAGSGG